MHVGGEWERTPKLLAARIGSDNDRKTWVLPIFECSTDLCDQFSENPRIVLKSLLDVGFFFFEMQKRKDQGGGS